MTKTRRSGDRLYGRFSLVTLIAVYILILVGGIVRTTGSGMGCPDWPKCFDQWVPPSSESELPADYRELYAEYRAGKNEKFARYLRFFNMDATADKLLGDKSVLQEREFNPVNTWIEYINRLVGALIGIFILLTCLFSFRYYKRDRRIFMTAAASLILVIFQGWIGSIVVSTNLVPWMVTVHMLLAVLIVFLLVYLVNRSFFNRDDPKPVRQKDRLLWLSVLAMAVVLVQIILGTQVREQIDEIAALLNDGHRGMWVERLGTPFLIHRSFSWIVLAVNAGLIYFMWNQRIEIRLIITIGGLLLLSVITGVTLAYLGMPAVIQPIHLLLGTLIIGLQFMLFLQLRRKRRSTELI